MTVNVPAPKLAVGQRVRVLVGKRNRTAHEGAIREFVWHFKDARHYYFLEEGGKKVSKRYQEEDLVEIEDWTD